MGGVGWGGVKLRTASRPKRTAYTHTRPFPPHTAVKKLCLKAEFSFRLPQQRHTVCSLMTSSVNATLFLRSQCGRLPDVVNAHHSSLVDIGTIPHSCTIESGHRTPSRQHGTPGAAHAGAERAQSLTDIDLKSHHCDEKTQPWNTQPIPHPPIISRLC